MSPVAVRDAVEIGHDHLAVPRTAPVVVAVDGSAEGRAAALEGVELAAELGAPVVFAYVRRGPSGVFGAPSYQRRLTREMARARAVLDDALAVADAAGVAAEREILEGSPGRRLPELGRDRGARLLVVGSRRRKLGRSVSRRVVNASRGPVVVASRRQRRAAATAKGNNTSPIAWAAPSTPSA